VTIAKLMNQACTVALPTAGTLDAYGDQKLVFGVPVATVGYLAQETSSEFTLNRDTVVSRWCAYLPAGTAITHSAIVTFQAQVFQVDGEPEFVYNPRTQTSSHVRCWLLVIGG